MKSWAGWFGERVTVRRVVSHFACGFDTAQGIEAGTAETERLSPKGESPVGNADAPVSRCYSSPSPQGEAS